jgi:hypothetical protein
VFGHETTAIMTRVSVFAKTGADGSTAALWIDDEGRQRIVHMGSGSGSTLTCVLAEDAVDFLRLIPSGTSLAPVMSCGVVWRCQAGFGRIRLAAAIHTTIPLTSGITGSVELACQRVRRQVGEAEFYASSSLWPSRVVMRWAIAAASSRLRALSLCRMWET